MMSYTWAHRFYEIARTVATWSKDPDRKVGAVLVDNRKRIRGTGYNGLPCGLDYWGDKVRADDHVHAEVNAILNANGDVRGCALFTTTFPCTPCAAIIIQAGIQLVWAPPPEYGSSSWWHSQLHAKSMFKDAGVDVYNAK